MIGKNGPSIRLYIKKPLRFGRGRSPGARFELATNGLTVRCSTAELTRNRKAPSDWSHMIVNEFDFDQRLRASGEVMG